VAVKKAPLSDDPEDYRATLVEHLEELRTRLFRSVSVLMVGWAAGWFLEPTIYAYFAAMVSKAIVKSLDGKANYIEVFFNTTEAFMLKIQLAFIIGLILTFPFLLLQAWGFIAPGLKASERKPIQRLAPLSAFLFILGASMCWLILPKAVGWFASYVPDFAGVQLHQHAGVMVFFCLKLLLAFGVGFQLPLIVWLLGAFGLYESAALAKHWREGAFGIFILAAIVTPSNDWFSMLMMAIPLTLLFLVSIWALRITEGRKKRRLKIEEND